MIAPYKRGREMFMRLVLTILATLALTAPLYAQDVPADAKPPVARAEKDPSPSAPLPAEALTSHTIQTATGPLAFKARTGAIRLTDAQAGTPIADIAYIAYERDTPDAKRPIIFAINGGPGASSAFLGLGALGPWRLRMDGDALAPSAPPRLTDNTESWLPFADIVLIDPPGTGYSRAIGEEARKRLYSAQGDIDALAVFIRRYLTSHDRLNAPKFIVGESYGANRAPRIARALAERENVGIDGIMLVSPMLEFRLAEGDGPFPIATRLPSYAAITRQAPSRTALADAEAYATGAFLTDFLRGPQDGAATDRIVTNVTAFTGLDSALVRQQNGRVDMGTYARERQRNAGRVLSIYDGDVAGFDPDPSARDGEWGDPILDALRAPMGTAMIALTRDTLKWPVGEARYEVLNNAVSRNWDWGRQGRAGNETISTLRHVLALDPRMRVSVLHGLSDLVTPYFATKLALDQLPAYGDKPRTRFVVLPGGHMFYARDDSRKVFRDEGRMMIEGK